jgi:hypothetical protein
VPPKRPVVTPILRTIKNAPPPEPEPEPAKPAAVKRAPGKRTPARRKPREANTPFTKPVDGDAEVKPPTKRAPRKKTADATTKLMGPTLFDVRQLKELVDAMGGGEPVEAFNPALKAVMMRQAGSPWHEVAQQCGYASITHAAADIVKMYQSVAMERGEEIQKYALQQELDRLDALQASIWDQAIGGDMDAYDRVLKTIAIRGKYQGFEKERREEGSRTIIISGGDTMGAELEAAARAAHPHLVIDSQPV